ncbi:hypothetical protein [Polymorphospora rubra]
MSRRLLRGLVAVTTFCVVLTTAAAPPSMAQDAAPSKALESLLRGSGTVASEAGLSPEVARTVDGTDAEDYERALSAYWTPERMRAARPVEEVRARAPR